MDIDPPEKAIGAFHASVNVSATILFLISFLMRWGRHWQLGWATFVVALVGYLLVAIGGYLGGALVFYKGVMINRNAYRTGPDDYKPAVATRELAEGQLRRVLVEDQPVLFLKFDGSIYAIGAVCSHYGAPLNDGKIVERTIECPWHASRFALDDGRVVQGPACAGIPVYDCQIVNDQVQIKLRH
jgi:nitrite reductase/ring-hydroxylating ferredoxin subunit